MVAIRNVDKKISLSIIEEGADRILKVCIPLTVYDIIKGYIPKSEEYVSSVGAREILQDKGYLCKTHTTLKKHAFLNRVESKISGKERLYNREQLYTIPNK